MSYQHLSIDDRSCIYALKKEGCTQKEIAKAIGRSEATVSRELGRNGGARDYRPAAAQRNYRKRRSACHRPGTETAEVTKEIGRKVAQKWSPDQMKAKSEMKLPSVSTIYRWIHDGKVPKVEMKDLRRKGNFRRGKTLQGKLGGTKSIHDRPKEIDERTEFGHWEGDTVVSSKGSKACVVTLRERVSRKYLAFKCQTKEADEVCRTIVRKMARHRPFIKSITVDNGKEFSMWRYLERMLDCDVYFCDPHSPWQKGANENGNGDLREFFPKKTDFAKVSEKDLKKALRFINERPRKTLGYVSQTDRFNELKKNCTCIDN